MTYTQQQIEHINQKVAEWVSIDPNDLSRLEIQNLQQKGQYEVLDKKLCQRIAFGTAGLRSSMELGFSHMNDVTVLQASQGLVSYILSNFDQTSGSNPSIVVGYDHRHHSQRFAEITASVALCAGLDVFYLGDARKLSPELDPLVLSLDYSKTVHTPMVPFTIKQVHADAGVMVTASHNPANDNGYKVYYANGCQIIPPHDIGIALSINANLIPWTEKDVWHTAAHFKKGLELGNLHEVHDTMTKSYVKKVKEELIFSKTSITFPFVYTPMHGVGQAIFNKVCSDFGASSVKFIDVEEQRDPNPDFPSVRFPNPEERGALDLAIKRAEAAGARLVIANDPDADRFSAAVLCSDQTWRQLTGNEIGALFGAYMLELVKSHKIVDSKSPSAQSTLNKTYLLNSTVSSQLLKAMAEKEGFHYEDTLTGFKWIGNRALDLKKDGFLVPFGYEEAIGYMFSVVDDKDGVSAATIFLQLYQHWFVDSAQFPDEKLHEIYKAYGWFKECNGYYKLDDVLKTKKIFDEIRESYLLNGQLYPQKIGDFDVVSWRDLTVGYDSSTVDNKPKLPTDANSQMITAVVRDSKGRVARFTCRGSGTEPKLKVYIEGKSEENEEDATEVSRCCWKTLENNWFHPVENGLEVVV